MHSVPGSAEAANALRGMVPHLFYHNVSEDGLDSYAVMEGSSSDGDDGAAMGSTLVASMPFNPKRSVFLLPRLCLVWPSSFVELCFNFFRVHDLVRWFMPFEFLTIEQGLSMPIIKTSLRCHMIELPRSKVVATAYPDRRDGVPTPAHTLGDDSLLIKYINPRLFAFATLSPEEKGSEKAGGDAAALNDKGQELTVSLGLGFTMT